MGNVDAHDHGLPFRDNADFVIVQVLVSSAELEVKLKRNISVVLVVGLCKFRA